MSESIFCPNCGQKINEGATYCFNCGYPLNRESKIKKNEVSRKIKLMPQKPFSKKLWISILLIILLLTGSYLFGRNYYSKSSQIDRLISAIQNNEAKLLINNSISSDSSLKLTENSIKPLTDYYANNKKDLARLKNQFNGTDQQNAQIDYVRDGKKLLIFPCYKMRITPVSPTIKINMNDVALFVNNKKVTNSINQDEGTKLNKLVPGLYHLKVEGNSNGQKLVNDSDQKWISNIKDINLELKIISVNINGEVGSSVYVSGKKVGQIDESGQYELNDYPFSNDMTIQTEAKTDNDKIIKSKPYKLSIRMNGNTITPEFEGTVSNSDASDFIESVWEPLDDQTITDKSSALDNNYDKYFDNGSSNSAYNDLIKMVDSYGNDSDLISYAMNTKVISIIPYKDNQSKVNYRVNYEFNYDNKPDCEKVIEYQAIIVGNPKAKKLSDNNYDKDEMPKYLMKSNSMIKKISETKDETDYDD